jgi:hypothetical protein
MSEKQVQANKHPEILVSENAVKKGMYALRLTQRQFTNKENTAWNDDVFVQYFSVRDFAGFQKYHMERQYMAVEIIHDPTLPVAQQATPPEPEPQPQAAEQPQVNKGGRPKKNLS